MNTGDRKRSKPNPEKKTVPKNQEEKITGKEWNEGLISNIIWHERGF